MVVLESMLPWIKVLAGPVVQFFCGPSNKKNTENAFKTIFARTCNGLGTKDRKFHQEMYDNNAIWEKLKNELWALSNPSYKRDFDKLCRDIGSLTSLKEDVVKSGVRAWCQIIDEEVPKQPDLYPFEAVQKAYELKDCIEKINAELGIYDIKQLDHKVKIASTAYLEKVVSNSNYNDSSIELDMKHETEDCKNQNTSLTQLIDFLRVKKKVLLKSEPGAGKSTILIQSVKHFISLDENIYPQYIDLPYWSGQDNIFEVLANRGAYGDEGLTKKNLQTLAKYGHLVFVFDGWNEISLDKRDHIKTAITNLLLEYPNTGVLLATRPTSITSMQSTFDEILQLKRLDDVKRNAIINQVMAPDEAKLLNDEIDARPYLKQLTTIPLYLNALISVFQTETVIPETKEQLFSAYNKKFNTKSELKEKLYNCHHSYMVQLSVDMLKYGSTALIDSDARQSVSVAAARLLIEKQIAAAAEPRDILEVLTQHHQLYYNGLDQSWQFQHQQIQEWFASFYVENLFIAAKDRDTAKHKELREQVLNFPVWEEAILFACERLSLQNDDGVDVVAFIAIEALFIDPLLTAEIIYRSPENVWQIISKDIVDFVKRWHTLGVVDRAVKFMINSGREEFSEFIWPFITSDENQTSLSAFRTVKYFRISVLGRDIQTNIRSLAPSVRELILSEIAYEGDLKGVELATDIALADRNPGVQAAVIKALQWRQASKQVNRLINGVSEDAIWFVANDNYLGSITDDNALIRVKTQIAKMTSSSGDPNIELRILSGKVSRDIGDGDKVAELISSIDFSQKESVDYHILSTLYDIYPEEVSTALINKLEKCEAVPYGVDDLFYKIDVTINDGKIAGHFLTYEKNNKLGDDLAPLVGERPIELLIARLQGILDSSRGKTIFDEELSNEYHELLRRILKTREKPFLRAIKNLANTKDINFINLLAELLSRHGASDHPSKYDLDKKLISIVQKWGEFILNSDDANRSDMAKIAQVIIRLPSPSLLSVLSKLLAEDISRKALEVEELIEGLNKGQNIQNEARMCYSWNYRDAFAAISSQPAIKVMKSYLNNLEFGEDAAQALKMIWQRRNLKPAPNSSSWNAPKFEGVKVKIENRSTGIKASTSGSFSVPIITIIEKLLFGEPDEESKIHALKLACVAFGMPFDGKLDLIEKLLELPNLPTLLGSKHRLMTELAKTGQLLSAERIRTGLEDFFQEAQEKTYLINYGDEWRVTEWLELFPFSDNPSLLFDVMDELEERFVRPDKLNSVLIALREVPVNIAEELLFEFVNLNTAFLNEYSWMNALIHTGTLNCAKFLLQQIENGEFENRTNNTYTLSQNLLHFVFKNSEFMEDLESCYSRLSYRVAESIVGGAISEKPTFDTVKLIFDKASVDNKSFGQTMLSRAIRNSIVGQKESEDFKGAFELFGQPAGELRAWLLSRTNDQNEHIASLAIEALTAIDNLRAEYGYVLSDPRHPDINLGLPWPLLN